MRGRDRTSRIRFAYMPLRFHVSVQYRTLVSAVRQRGSFRRDKVNVAGITVASVDCFERIAEFYFHSIHRIVEPIASSTSIKMS